MPKVEYWYKQDLKKPVNVHTYNGSVFTLDNAGSLIGVEVYSDGEPVTLTGTVNGYVILPDEKTTVLVSGTRSENKAYIALPQSALAYPGFIKITIKLTNSSEITTLLKVVAIVEKSRTDTVITPSSQIITDWSQQIAAEMQSVEDASAAQDVKINDLKSVFTNTSNAIMNPVSGLLSFEQGRFDRTTGNTANSSAVIRTTDFIPENVVRISCSSSYKFIIWAWKKSDGTHVGHRTSDGSYGTASSYLYETDHIFDWDIGYKYKITFYNADSSNIEPSAGINCITWTATDKTLSKAEKAADAGAVGEMYGTLKNAISLGFEIPLMESHGYIKSSDGTLYPSNNQTYGYSVMCHVNPGEMYEYKFKVSDSVLGIAAYEDAEDEAADLTNSIAGNSSVTAISGVYIVPEGITALRICSQRYQKGNYFMKRYVPESSVSILFIGNSLTQDGIAYLPYLLKNYYPEIDFKFYMWYHGGYTLAEHYDDFINNRVAKIFSVAENTGSWTNYNESKTMAWVLANYKFDMVCLEGYYNYTPTTSPAKPTDDVTAFNNVRDYIQSNYTGGNGLEFITLFHAPLRSDAATVFARTAQWNAAYLQETIAEDMIPIGIAVYRALSTTLDSLGDQGHLSPDGTHTQEGLPCLLQTYTALCWLFDRLSINKSVYGFPFKMTTAIYETINVPGPNLGTGVIEGTDAQNLLAQEVAIKAYKEGKKFVADNIYSSN